MKPEWFAVECIVFTVFILASSLGPLWCRKKDAKSHSSAKKAYIFAQSGVSIWSMMLSITRGTLGVRSFLGFPSELVYHGTAIWETLYGVVFSFPVVCMVFVPVYYRLRANSVYEYLQMRFGSISVRRLAAGTFLVRQVLNMAVTVYTPTVALHATFSLPHWVSALALTIVGIVFNLLGGLSAAIRADVVQTITMITICVIYIVQGNIKAKGPKRIVEANMDGGRLLFCQYTWDPTVRVDTLSAIFGQLFMSISVYGCQQTFVQRYCSMSSETRVRKTLFANIPAVIVLFSLSWIVGMGVYAIYKYCDPLASGIITVPDAILPYYVRDQFAFLPGMLGLFLGSLFNGALTFLVSNVNSLATVTWEDFVSALPPFRKISDKKQLLMIRILGIIHAFLIMLLSLAVGIVGGVVEGSLLVTSATSGALLGVFTLAALCPMANSIGAICGIVLSHVVTVWLATGRLMYVNSMREILPLSIAGCANKSSTKLTEADLPLTLATRNETLKYLAPVIERMQELRVTADEEFYSSTLYKIYSVSYMWYAVIGTLICILFGVVIGCITRKETDKFDAKLLHPVISGKCKKYTKEINEEGIERNASDTEHER